MRNNTQRKRGIKKYGRISSHDRAGKENYADLRESDTQTYRKSKELSVGLGGGMSIARSGAGREGEALAAVLN